MQHLLLQVHELRREGDAERLVRVALDAAPLNPAGKAINNFVAVGGDHAVNAGARCCPPASILTPSNDWLLR